MRRLQKGPEPAILVQNAATWTSEILNIIANGEAPTETQRTRYNHQDIKSAVKGETFDKCAYCESKVTHIDHGDIEHIIPKSKDPLRSFDWTNLTLACRLCNQAKGDFFDPQDDHNNLVDPYVHEPLDHFLFKRELVIPRPDSSRGLHTDEQLKLSRTELREFRRANFDFIDGMLRSYCNAPLADKPIIKRQLYKLCCDDSSQFAALNRHYIDDVFGTLGI